MFKAYVKKGEIMIRKFFLLSILFVFIFLSCGCHTIVKGFNGACEGAKEDWAVAKKADAWVQDNLW